MNKQQKDKKMKNKQPTATFCITGALEKYKRVDAIVEIHNKTNARFVSGVSSRTDYLISSRKDTSKAKSWHTDDARCTPSSRAERNLRALMRPPDHK